MRQIDNTSCAVTFDDSKASADMTVPAVTEHKATKDANLAQWLEREMMVGTYAICRVVLIGYRAQAQPS